MNKLKNIFCIKDVMYLGIILALLLAIIAMNVDLKNKQNERCWNMIKEMANSSTEI